MVGGNTAWEEVSGDEHSLDRRGICFSRIGDEDCPNRKELSELEGILASREVEFDLQRKLACKNESLDGIRLRSLLYHPL